MTGKMGLSERLRSILVMLATTATIAFNGMAAAGYINGVTPGEVSTRYPSILTPAAYAFSIWSLIYLGLAAFSVYQMLPAQIPRFRGIRTPYIASCLLNISWIYFWHHDRVGVCALLITALAAVLLIIVAKTKLSDRMLDIWLLKGTFGLYAGWVTVASIVNVFVYLASMGYAFSASTVLAVVAVLIATFVAVLIVWLLGNHFFPITVAWALTAIAVKQSGETSLIVACAVGVIICLVAALSFVVKLPSMETRMRHE